MSKAKKRLTAATTTKKAPKARLVFSESADKQLRKLAPSDQESLKKKLASYAINPELGKPLTGPLAGYHRVTSGRVRAVAKAAQDAPIAVIATIALRKEDNRDDVYELAKATLAAGGKGLERLLMETVRAYLAEHSVVGPQPNEPSKRRR